jgi:taurine dioxygenase
MILVEKSGQACGAKVSGLDLSCDLEEFVIESVRAAWLEHHVLAFPNQKMSDDDLVRVAQYFGKLGAEPFFIPMEGSDHVVALTRRADEKAPVFAENWHSDWAFLEDPPIGTCLYSLVIPPVGGNTGFTNQHRALVEMPASLRDRIEGRIGLYSAAAAYAPDGMYGEQEDDSDRSMKIIYSEEARNTQRHSIVYPHPETGNLTIRACLGYLEEIGGMDKQESLDLLMDLYQWQTREEFQYTHEWEPGMFVIWDNRSCLHRAYGGYDGYDRELHRITVYSDPGRYL